MFLEYRNSPQHTLAKQFHATEKFHQMNRVGFISVENLPKVAQMNKKLAQNQPSGEKLGLQRKKERT